jgi:hypothetical protein
VLRDILEQIVEQIEQTLGEMDRGFNEGRLTFVTSWMPADPPPRVDATSGVDATRGSLNRSGAVGHLHRRGLGKPAPDSP